MGPEIYIEWSNFLNKIRKFFIENNFIEVTTSHIVKAGAFEHSIDALKVTSKLGVAELHTSPEIEMKVVLSETKLPIYQICQCFRDDPPSQTHLLEFTMLEFYRPYESYIKIMQDVEDLIKTISKKKLTFYKYSIDELFKNLGISLLECDTKEKLADIILRKKLFKPLGSDTWEDLFFKIMLDFIEPGLPMDPTFIVDYPSKLAALAKIKYGWAERFELYWNRVEICNGCSELTSYEELLKRIEVEKNARISNMKSPHPLPERLLHILKKGFPNSSGVAIGLNRLFSCSLGAQSLLNYPLSYYNQLQEFHT